MAVKKKVKTSKGIIQLRADKNVFARLAVMAQTRSMDMRQVMSFPIGPVPWSLACPDGSLVKTAKAKLLHFLEEDSQPLVELPFSAWILDGMALLQALQDHRSTLRTLQPLFCS